MVMLTGGVESYGVKNLWTKMVWKMVCKMCDMVFECVRSPSNTGSGSSLDLTTEIATSLGSV